MKSRVKITDEFIGHLPAELGDSLADALKDAECEPVLKRVPTIEPVQTGVDGAGSATLYASTRRMDRDNEIVFPGPLNISGTNLSGMSLEQYNLAPILLFAHQWSDLPIGSMRNTHSDGYGIKGVASFSNTSRAQDVWTLVKEGHLRTSSIGFIPTEIVDKSNPLFPKLLEFALQNWGEFTKKEAVKIERFITRGIMLENSIVPVPANPDALVQAVHGKSLDPELVKMFGLEADEKGIVISHETSDATTNIWIDDVETTQTTSGAETVEEVLEGCIDVKPKEEKHVKCIARLIRGPEAKTVKRASAEDVAALAALAKKHLELRTGKI